MSAQTVSSLTPAPSGDALDQHRQEPGKTKISHALHALKVPTGALVLAMILGVLPDSGRAQAPPQEETVAGSLEDSSENGISADEEDAPVFPIRIQGVDSLGRPCECSFDTNMD